MQRAVVIHPARSADAIHFPDKRFARTCISTS
nr:MAG TPA_asm: hypothetical protein [Caudoviricetes sp.]